MSHEIEDLVVIARNRDRARIGLPPSPRDTTASVVWIIGTRSLFRSNPVRFDRVVVSGPVIQLDFPTTQKVGVIDDTIVITIEVPDVPNALDMIDTIHDKTSQLLLVGGWFTSTLINKIVVNQVVLEVQKIRLRRSANVLAAVETVPRARFRALVQTARIQQSIEKRGRRIVTIGRQLRRPTRIAGRAVARLGLKAFLFVGLAIDIIVVTHATVQGAQRAGPAGAIGGFVGAVADALTLGLLEEQTTDLGTTIEEAVGSGGAGSFLDIDPKLIGIGAIG